MIFLLRKKISQESGLLAKFFPERRRIDIPGRDTGSVIPAKLLVLGFQRLMRFGPLLFHLIRVGENKYGVFQIIQGGNESALLEESQVGEIRRDFSPEEGIFFALPVATGEQAPGRGRLGPSLQEVRGTRKFPQGRNQDSRYPGQ